MKRTITLLPMIILFCISGQAQQGVQQGHVQIDRSGPVPVFRVTVVAHTTQAVNYLHRSGPTTIDFRGTALMPEAKGEADVNSKQGRIQINARMEHLSPATQYGPEYLTYVLWAVTPEGRPKNLGEVLLDGTHSKMEVTTDLQTFGLIVTAEPYFAVTQPSDVVVMENFIRNDTLGTIQPIDAKYELLQRGQYVLNVNPSELRPFPLDRKVPLELYEARNAVRIARWTGADQYAADTLQKAEESLQNAEDELMGKVGKKTVSQNSRDAAQNAEDARLITIRKMEEEEAANERAAAAAQRESEANAQAAQAESQRASAERAKLAADQATADAERAKSEAQIEAARAAQERNDAEAARAAALAQQQATQAQLDQARQSAAQAEQERSELREQLREQLNMILETRETARGLIVNMSDVLFDTGKYTLKPGAREKLAKISGIILAHPGLKLEVEGHTDSVGSDEYNQQLSEQRAASVRDYLVSQGVSSNAVTALGFGKSRPVTDNLTAAGRQQNRRVELVVSGEAIGVAAGQASR